MSTANGNAANGSAANGNNAAVAGSVAEPSAAAAGNTASRGKGKLVSTKAEREFLRLLIKKHDTLKVSFYSNRINFSDFLNMFGHSFQ